MIRTAVAVALTLTLTGCASKAPASHEPHVSAQPTMYRPATGESATSIAQHIPGCIRITRLSTGHSPTLASAASCELNTDTVIIDSWAGLTKVSDAVVPRPTWFVDGGTWTGFVADRGVSPERSWLQLALTGNVAGVQRARAHPPQAIPLHEQQRVAISVASGVQGAVREAR